MERPTVVLPQPELADDAEHLALGERQRDAVDRLHPHLAAGPLHIEAGVQVPHLKDRAIAHAAPPMTGNLQSAS